MPNTTPSFNDILLYAAPSGDIKIEVIFEGETFYLSQKKIAKLFDVEVPTINYTHIHRVTLSLMSST